MNIANIKKTGLGILIGAILMIGVQFASAAWPTPTNPPTGGNVQAPVNTGPITQTKPGTLGVNTLIGLTGLFGQGSSGYAPGSLILSARAQNTYNAGILVDNSGRLKIYDNSGIPALGSVLTLVNDPQNQNVGTFAEWRPGGATLPNATDDQTLRYETSGTPGWVANSFMRNSGSKVTITDTPNPDIDAGSQNTLLMVNGRVKIRGGNPMNGHVLTATNNIGDAVWKRAVDRKVVAQEWSYLQTPNTPPLAAINGATRSLSCGQDYRAISVSCDMTNLSGDYVNGSGVDVCAITPRIDTSSGNQVTADWSVASGSYTGAKISGNASGNHILSATLICEKYTP